MIVYALMARGSTLLAEYGIGENDFGTKSIKMVKENSKRGSSVVSLEDNFACILNKEIDDELYSFVAVIERKDARDLAFDLLEKISDFFIEEKANNSSKITQEITLHMSRQIRVLMESANRSRGKKQIETIKGDLDKASEMTKSNITSMLENKMKLEDLEYNSSTLRESVSPQSDQRPSLSKIMEGN